MKLRMRIVQILWSRRYRAFGGVIAAIGITAAAFGLWAAYQAATPAAPQLAALLPQGALLTIEAKDFSALLKQWNSSPEQAAWLKSDNYSVFSNSRLFGRLSGAQDEFAAAAGLPPDLSFLKEVAGTQSIFAWYDIGNLEFLYITHMSSATAQQTRLLQMRNKFTTRQVGGQTFYVRTQTNPEGQGQPRTVAFATSGDWLLLATREDLMAGALSLMSSAAAGNANSLAAEPWFVDAGAAAGRNSAQLRMTLNLEKIVPTPYFRSYWIQRNITEMKQFRSAVADLHMESGSFREERVLLPKSPLGDMDAGTTPDLMPLLRLLPQHSGVYRAQARPGAEAVLGTLNEKLLQRGVSAFSDNRYAPNADLAVQQVGSAGSLETRIDAAPLARPAPGSELAALRQALGDSNVDAMLTLSRTGPANDGVWIPFQSAVVLASAKDWDADALQAALQRALQANLTTSNLGLAWKPMQSPVGNYLEISSARPLELAVQGRLCILADSPALMQEMLARAASAASVAASKGNVIAGFEPAQERTSFARWTALVDRSLSGGQAAEAGTNGSSASSPGTEPAFFSKNLRSLGQAFASLDSERFVEQRDQSIIRQTVTYTWRK